MIDYLDIAEALVHEAIHSLLYMQERCHPWVPAELYAPVPRVVSPWRGRNLALRPFLQACFVWYGILQFWGKATTTGTLRPHRWASRCQREPRGGSSAYPFCSVYVERITKLLLLANSATITEMQTLVQDVFT